jgi:hypothetical protein
MAKPTVDDLKALTDAELETLQLQVNAEVAIRLQNERLEHRLVTAITEAQSVGFTDAEIDTVITKSREKAKKGERDPAKPTPGPDLTKKPGKGFSDPNPSVAKMKAMHEQGK